MPDGSTLILVHNVSHGDIVLAARCGRLCKPAPQRYAALTAAVWAACSVGEPEVLVTTAAGARTSVPYGLRLPVPLFVAAADVQFRGAEEGEGNAVAGERVDIAALIFPAMGALLATWLSSTAASSGSGGSNNSSTFINSSTNSCCGASATQQPRRSLFLISGPSVADDADRVAVAEASTTEHSAALVGRFVTRTAPEVAVSHVVSSSELLRYDTAIHFLKTSLVPHLDAARRAVVAEQGDGWRRHFGVCVTLAAGAPVRTAALSAAVRTYQPSTLHLAAPKSFWVSGSMDMTLASVASLDFDATEGTPSELAADVADEDVRETIAQMRSHLAAFLRAVRGSTANVRTTVQLAPLMISAATPPPGTLAPPASAAMPPPLRPRAHSFSQEHVALPLVEHLHTLHASGGSCVGEGSAARPVASGPPPSPRPAHFCAPVRTVSSGYGATAGTGGTGGGGSGSGSGRHDSVVYCSPTAAAAAASPHAVPPDLDVVDTGRVTPSLPTLVASTPAAVAHEATAHDGSGGSSGAAVASGPAASHELSTFWLRKTRQPVLAVLLVRKGADAPRQFYFGCNVEVSMPTGSICSERVAISSALAADPGLRREHLRMIAVLSLPKLEHPDPRAQLAYETAGIAPAAAFYSARKPPAAAMAAAAAAAAAAHAAPTAPGSASPAASGIGDCPPSSFQAVAAAPARPSIEALLMPPPPASLRRRKLVASPAQGGSGSVVAGGVGGGTSASALGAGGDNSVCSGASSPVDGSAGGADDSGNDRRATLMSSGGRSMTQPAASKRPRASEVFREDTAAAAGAGDVPGFMPRFAAPTVPPPAILARHASGGGGGGSGCSVPAAPWPAWRTAQAQQPPLALAAASSAANGDDYPVSLNPINPCGSCTEWLRKVNEVNPDFRCITFTNISCERIFIKPVA